MRASRTILIAGVGLAMLAGGAAAVALATGGAAAPVEPAAPPAVDTPALAGVVPAPWRPAERRSYRVALRAVLTPQGAGDEIVLGWTGRLVLTALGVADGRAAIAAEFTGTAETNQDHRATAEIDAGLRLPWFAIVDDDGRALEIGVMPRMPTSVTSAWKALLGHLQFVGATGAAQWTTEEDDSTGRYRARYAPGSAPATWTKIRSDYVALHPRGALAQDQTAYRIDKAEATFRFDAASRIAGLEVDERVATHSQPPIPSFVATTRISLELEAADTAPPAACAALDAARAEARFAALASGPDERMRRDELDRGLLARVSVPELLAQLDAGPPADQAARERRARVDKIAGALLRQEPQRTAEIERRVALPRSDRGALLEILRDAGTPDAQAALLRLAARPALAVHDRNAALQSLGLVRRATRDTVVALERLIDSDLLGIQARFSLGSAVARLRASEPALATSAVDVLLAHLARAGRDDEVASYVRALGNAGDPRTADELGRRARSPAAEIRGAALWSLRSIEDARAEDVLLGAATTGDDPDRAAAVRTLAFRPLTARAEAALAARLRGDPSPRVREDALRTTQPLLRRSQALRDAVAWCQSHDAVPKLRDTATRALAALPPALAGAP